MLIDKLLGRKNIEPKYDDTRWFNIAEKPVNIKKQEKNNKDGRKR